MKDKIEKLLNSPVYEDVLLGIELAYELPFIEFDRLFLDRRKLGCEFKEIHRFGRQLTDYHIICNGEVLRYDSTKYKYTVKQLKNYKYEGWVNLGYKEN